MLELRKLHLHFTFVAAGALGKDVEYQARTVDYPAVQALLEIALLHGREIVIEDRERRLRDCDGFGDLFDFALTGKERGVGPVAAAAHDRERPHACACRKLFRFRQAFRVIGLAEVETDENGRDEGARAFCHQEKKKRDINYSEP
jgi:hypothetical protein